MTVEELFARALRIITGVGCVQTSSRMVDDSPTGRGAGVFYSSDKGENTSFVITVNGDLADGRDIDVKDWQIGVSPHSEWLMAGGLASEYRIRQGSWRVLMQTAILIDAEGL